MPSPHALTKQLALLSITMVALIVGGWIFITARSEAVASPATTTTSTTATATTGTTTTSTTTTTAATSTGPQQETATVATPLPTPPIPKSFLGFSVEYQSVAVDAGTPQDPDPLFDKLIETLNPGQRPVIRIGGDSTDHTWYPVAGAGSPGLTYALTPTWISSVATFARALNAQMILGIDLEMNNPQLARAEADALEGSIGQPNILAWEIGNEPSNYGGFPWYVTIPNDIKSGVYTRPPNFSFADYLKQYNATAVAIPHLPLAGPALGSPTWMVHLPTMLREDPGLEQVTYHAYPLNCFAAPGTPGYPSIADLLAPDSSAGLANLVAPFERTAAAAHRAFRVDELNSSACGGTAGVSNTFASALWATDTLFAMASKGVTGVNIQTFDGSRYRPFAFTDTNGAWSAQVAPMYYGLLLFSQAAPAGSRLLAVNTKGPSAPALSVWAAQTPGSGPGQLGPETVTLINNSTTRSATVKLSVPDTTGGTLARLLAPNVAATSGETIDGLSYGASTSTGTLTGRSTAQQIKPVSGDTYAVTLAPASAATLSLAK